jgi:chromosomal replication initiator protein
LVRNFLTLNCFHIFNLFFNPLFWPVPMPLLSKDVLWSSALEHIRSAVNDQTYQTWFLPVRISRTADNLVTLAVPNRFFGDWIRDHYRDLVEKSLKTVSGAVMRVEFETRERELSQGPLPLPENTFKKTDKPLLQSSITKRQQVSSNVLANKAPQPPGLNQRYTFDTFVIGNNNRFAHAASLAVANSPARAYNPLFIHGQVGMGKTHLLQGIAHEMAAKDPEVRICYISSEQFTNQLIGAIQNRSTQSFRNRYRGVDILLIDDIQFIAGKESTQEEFFHTFNTLYDAHKQIVVSCDRAPKEIATLEERLVSRFEWGLIADIQQPDIETRTAIVRKKAERENVFVPDEVTNFIGEHIKSNIRELEGALIRVSAYSELTNTPVTLELAKQLLKDTLQEEENKITIDLIQRKVAGYFDIRPQEMHSKKRSRAIAYPRQIAMYLCRQLTDHSLPAIGENFGGRDHATVLHACDKIKKEIVLKRGISGILTQLTSQISGRGSL